MMEMARDIGRHDAQIETLQADMAEMKKDVHEIKLMLAQAKGGWKTLMAVGGAAAFFGGLFVKVVDWLWK
jgi:putative NADH-flavin reductase